MKKLRRSLALVLVLGVVAVGCSQAPPALTPEAQVAFQANRVVKVLDVVRDAAIAANELTPPLMTTADTRNVVLWHKTSLQVIQAVPDGWKATVRKSLFVLTCYPQASDVQPPPPCTPQIAPTEAAHLTPYVALVLVVIGEIQ